MMVRLEVVSHARPMRCRATSDMTTDDGVVTGMPALLGYLRAHGGRTSHRGARGHGATKNDHGRLTRRRNGGATPPLVTFACMSAIIGLFHCDGRPVDPEIPGRMLDRLVHRGKDAAALRLGESWGLGARIAWTTPESRLERMPLVSPEGGLVLVADARIDNRHELLRLLLPLLPLTLPLRLLPHRLLPLTLLLRPLLAHPHPSNPRIIG